MTAKLISRLDLCRGIPELNLRPTEPLVIPHLTFNTGRGIVSVKSEFADVSSRPNQPNIWHP